MNKSKEIWRQRQVTYNISDLGDLSSLIGSLSWTIQLYYSFKMFSCFRLVKTTRKIHHNQPLLTKFGKNFVILNRWRQNDVKSAAWLQVIEPLTGKTWRRGWVVLVVWTKWRNNRGTFYSFYGEILSKNIARTARRQLDGQHLLFAVWSIFVDLSRPLSPKLPDKGALSIWTYIDRG